MPPTVSIIARALGFRSREYLKEQSAEADMPSMIEGIRKYKALMEG